MKIAIAGYGVEGRANYAYWRDKGDVTIVDERSSLDDAPEGVATILGDGAFSKLDGFDMVVRTAGLAPYKIQTNGKIWSATNEFFARCPAPIIGVTGTKGKGTTSSLITSILAAAGKTTHLVGNIGQSALEVLDVIKPGDIVVYELSSFQLWDIERSPHVAVVLMIEPDHLDVHRDLADYLTAKMNIVKFQQPNDVAIYTHDSNYSELTDVARLVEPRGIPVPDPDYIDMRDGYFYCYDQKLCPLSSLRIPGEHNIVNACAAIAAAWEYTQDASAVQRGLEAFTGLEHRLKFVKEVRGVKYYDDSIGTTVGSAIAALKSFSEPKVIILGGSSKGTSYEAVVAACRESDTRVIAVGQTGSDIIDLCERYGVVALRIHGLMDEVVAKADEIAHAGDVVILSPASASFDQYDNYAARGEAFIAAVEALAD